MTSSPGLAGRESRLHSEGDFRPRAAALDVLEEEHSVGRVSVLTFVGRIHNLLLKFPNILVHMI